MILATPRARSKTLEEIKKCLDSIPELPDLSKSPLMDRKQLVPTEQELHQDLEFLKDVQGRFLVKMQKMAAVTPTIQRILNSFDQIFSQVGRRSVLQPIDNFQTGIRCVKQ